MDKAKLRMLSGLGGAMIGFAGLPVISYSGVIVTALLMSLTIVSMIAGVVLMGFANWALYFCLSPRKSVHKETDQFEGETADSVAELPIDVLHSMVD